MLRVHKRGGQDMRPTTLRIFSVAILMCVVSVVGFVLANIFQWPSEFVTGEVTEHNVPLADIGSGTVSIIPLAHWIALVVFDLLARGQRWWGPSRWCSACWGVLLTIGGLSHPASVLRPA
jgi:hypothetical protein